MEAKLKCGQPERREEYVSIALTISASMHHSSIRMELAGLNGEFRRIGGANSAEGCVSEGAASERGVGGVEENE